MNIVNEFISNLYFEFADNGQTLYAETETIPASLYSMLEYSSPYSLSLVDEDGVNYLVRFGNTSDFFHSRYARLVDGYIFEISKYHPPVYNKSYNLQITSDNLLALGKIITLEMRK